MRRILTHLPLVALAIATAVLFYAGLTLRDPAAIRVDRQTRRDFAVAVQRGERPRVAARNLGGVLRQELEAQDAAAADRARLATWLQVAAVLSLLGLGASIGGRAPERRAESSVAAA
jgi:hypothetical protein